jgi:hypothetical protein
MSAGLMSFVARLRMSPIWPLQCRKAGCFGGGSSGLICEEADLICPCVDRWGVVRKHAKVIVEDTKVAKVGFTLSTACAWRNASARHHSERVLECL